MPAPVALFVYQRPDHTARTIAALKGCDGFAATPVTVFADGAKGEADRAAVEAVRALVAAELPTAMLVAAPANQGLARSIIAGVDRIIAAHGQVIVLEDDLIVAPDFLTFMNAALDRYADDERVMQVSGYLPRVARRFDAAIFLPQTSSWTWATWQRAWRAFEAAPSATERLATDAALRRRFNRQGTYDYARALTRQMRGETDSWAIRWYWSVFKAGGLTLYPPQTLAANIGFDGSGTHGARGIARAMLAPDVPPRGGPFGLPDRIEIDVDAERIVNRAYQSMVRNPLALVRAGVAAIAAGGRGR